MHEQNKHLLPNNKKFRIVGYKPRQKDPYREIASRKEIEGSYEFDFQANVANSSKIALQQALQMAMSATDRAAMGLQTGVVPIPAMGATMLTVASRRDAVMPQTIAVLRIVFQGKMRTAAMPAPVMKCRMNVVQETAMPHKTPIAAR